MKLARVDGEGKIVELFDQKGIDKKFHPDFVKTLVRVGAAAELDDYVSDGKLIGKKPDDESKAEGGKWVKDDEVVKLKRKNKKLDDARARLKDLSKIADEGVRQAIADILFIMKAGEE